MKHAILYIYLSIAFVVFTSAQVQAQATHILTGVINTKISFSNPLDEVILEGNVLIDPEGSIVISSGVSLLDHSTSFVINGELSIIGSPTNPTYLFVNTDWNIQAGGMVTLDNIEADVNKSLSFFATNSTLSISNTSFTLNDSIQNNLFECIASDLSFKNLTFKGRELNKYFYINGGNFYFNSIDFAPHAGQYLAIESANGEMHNIELSDRKTLNNAPFIYLSGGTIEVHSLTLKNNIADWSPLFLSNNSNTSLHNCLVAGNHFLIETTPSEPAITNPRPNRLNFHAPLDFNANRGLISSEGALNIHSSNFTGNTPEWEAGLIHINNSLDNTIKSCIFENNKVINGIDPNPTSPAQSTNTGTANIINVQNSQLFIFEDCNYLNNAGGVFFKSSTEVIIKNNKFTSNTTSSIVSEQNGGALFIQNTDAIIQNNLFSKNKANLNGGAISIHDSQAEVNNNIFYDNETAKKGGAIEFNYYDQQDTRQNTVVNNLFYNNTAKISGSALYSEGIIITISNSIFWKNKSLQFAKQDSIQIEIYVGVKLPTLTHNIIESYPASFQLYSDADLAGYVYANTDENPLFENELNYNFHVKTLSPAINAGIDSLAKWNVDFEGENRKFGDTRIDIGVYETSASVSASDSLALVAIYNATNGPNWTNKTGWLSSSIKKWHGVTIAGGKVSQLNLSNNNLTGEIPQQISGLSELEVLDLSFNKLTKMPIELQEIEGLKHINFSENDLTNMPNFSKNTFYRLKNLIVKNNRLVFDDLLPNYALPNFIYSPQDSILTNEELGIVFNSEATLHMQKFSDPDNLITYKWYKDRVLVHESPEHTLRLQNFNQSMAGNYICYATHNYLPLLDLPRKTIKVTYIPPSANTKDSLALVDLYNSTKGNSWNNNTNWLSTDVRHWYGVKLLEGRVIGLNLTENALDGEIPISINELEKLTEINLSDNELEGVLPLDFTKLPNLVILNCEDNNLTGQIPDNIVNATNLTVLNLASNYLNEVIPAAIGNLTQLVQLSLSANAFSGTIPSSIAHLTKLTTLELDQNKLSGSIDFSFENLHQLSYIDLNKNILTGKLPSGLTHAIKINLSNNKFVGQITTDILNNSKIKSLNFSNNLLSGNLPSSISNLKSIEELTLNNNLFDGEIPTSIGELETLIKLRLDHNKFSGSIPTTFSNLERIQELNLGFNTLTGTIPSIFTRLNNITHLLFHNNKLTGEIQKEIGSLKNLIQLSLYSNQLTGIIPNELCNLTNLEILELNTNNLSGALPENIGNLKSLKYFSVRSNNLSGRIPDSFTNLEQLEKCYLYYNQFTGIPNISQLKNIEVLLIFGNKIEIGDFEPIIDVCEDLQYIPQVDSTTYIVANFHDAITIGTTVSGSKNEYRWTKGTTPLNITTETITFNNLSLADIGTYTLTVSSLIDKIKLTLTYRYVISITPEMPEIDFPRPYCFGDNVITLQTENEGGETHWYLNNTKEKADTIGTSIDRNIEQDSITIYVQNVINNAKSEFLEMHLRLRPNIEITNNQFTANSEPNATYTWHLNNKFLSSEQSITPTTDGVYTVTLNLAGCAASKTIVWQNGEVMQTTATHITPQLSGITVGPNPAAQQITINWQSDFYGQSILSLYTMKGQIVLQLPLHKQNRTWTQNLPLSQLPAGNYQLKISNKKGIYTKTIIKQ